MNPIQISQRLQDTLVSYLTTTFDVNRDGSEPELANMIRQSFRTPGALFNGPFLELTPPYKQGNTLADLIEDGVLTDQFRDLPCFDQGLPIPLDAPLYSHQQNAINRLVVDGNNIVVSSGTGSGKTECFLIPIMNDLLLDDTPGVRALLIYPMNALVNDQLDRLRRLLAGTPITFGRYTSELEQTEKRALEKLRGVEILPNEVICREHIQTGERIPQILITNYAMLEYLLLRPEDSTLFNSGLWRFIVLDEAHTYTGAQGVEVAMLIRRLKHRLGKHRGDVQCIATSATLTNDESDLAAKFAVDLFDEDIQPEDVVFGEIDPDYSSTSQILGEIDPECYLHDDFDSVLKLLRAEDNNDLEAIAIYLHDIGLLDDNKFALISVDGMSAAYFLWHVMNGNPHLIRLRNWMLENIDKPARPADVAEWMFGSTFDSSEERLQALLRLVELGAIAREHPDYPPLLPARYHLFSRPPQGVWACINPSCSGRESSEDASWSRLFTHRTEKCDVCGCHTYPITVCRECGQVYLKMVEDNNELMPANEVDIWDASESRYFTWKTIHKNYALGTDIDEDEESQVPSSKLDQDEHIICICCGQYEKRCTCDEPVRVQLWQIVEHHEKKSRGKVLKQKRPLDFMNQCPRCLSTAQRKTEIVTSITIAGTTPLATLTYELYRYLPQSTKQDVKTKPGNGRKLLTFYDSRQGAARFAAFLQDTTNQLNYRHVIPTAVKTLQNEEGYPPDLEDVSKICTNLLWDLGIFHNDPDSDEWRKASSRLSRSQRKRLMQKTQAEIVAEFTTRRDQRQSLETLGLVSVEYFEDEVQAIQDLEAIATEIGLNPEQTLSLIQYLLDDLRKKKIVELPDGVDPDDPVFGRNKFSPRLTRGGGGNHEESWLGKTDRKLRRRLVQKMLSAHNLPADTDNVVDVLSKIWEWLVDRSDLLEGQASDGYQLRNDRMFFNADALWDRCDTCLRLSSRGNSLPCPHPDCNGQLHEFNPHEMPNFFAQLFQREVIPLRVEEHTAQLDSIKGRNYQDGFRDGDINILSCSTTFEMGIDLGDLQAVSMSNVPPTVANYRQRAGRAGRRSSGTALIFTWAADRPHDQLYFRDPIEIIHGNVRVPYISLDNEFISHRHINAILLSSFLRYQYTADNEDLRRLGTFFDPQVIDLPHYRTLEDWFAAEQNSIFNLLDRFRQYLHNTSDVSSSITSWIQHFRSELSLIEQHYTEISSFYRKQIEDAIGSQTVGNPTANKEANDRRDFYEKLLKRLQDEYLINYLSDRGFLPSYSFPLHTVELLLPPQRDTEHLRLQRNLRQAIREYAPGSEIVADKRIWRSAGLLFYRETPRSQEYHICHNCGHLQISSDPGKPLPQSSGQCDICHEPYNVTSKRVSSFLTPDGFKADWKSGQPAKQYVISNRGRERTALIPPASQNELQYGQSMLLYDYQRDGELLYVNEGRNSRGYKICFDCGTVLSDKDRTCKATVRGGKCPGSRIEVVALGHVQQTDTLKIRFTEKPDVIVPSPDDRSFWMSVMSALIHGASRALQIERRDIDGVLYPHQSPDGKWTQSIVLFDDVPGGAGHVKQISNEFSKVISEAIRILNCTDCNPDTSCTHCLRDYSNQYSWSLLERHKALRFLETLKIDMSQKDSSVHEVVALNLPYWLMRQAENTRQEILIAVDSITLSSPFGSNKSWLDVIAELLQRNIQVSLYLPKLEIDRQTPELITIAHYLNVLIGKPLNLFWVDTLPNWRIIQDPNDIEYCRAIRPRIGDLHLDETSGEAGLETTIDSATVSVALQQLLSNHNKPANVDDLKAPSNIDVVYVGAYQKNITEQSLFGKLFEHPVRELTINDPYLIDAERIINRLGAYVKLANQHQSLEMVKVLTKRAGTRGVQGTAEEQDRYFKQLETRFGCPVRPTYNPRKVEHDRSIIIDRMDGSQAQILIGRGLEFIRSDGTVASTYVVIQDPVL